MTEKKKSTNYEMTRILSVVFLILTWVGIGHLWMLNKTVSIQNEVLIENYHGIGILPFLANTYNPNLVAVLASLITILFFVLSLHFNSKAKPSHSYNVFKTVMPVFLLMSVGKVIGVVWVLVSAPV